MKIVILDKPTRSFLMEPVKIDEELRTVELVKALKKSLKESTKVLTTNL